MQYTMASTASVEAAAAASSWLTAAAGGEC
jgi:hypothetical protein